MGSTRDPSTYSVPQETNRIFHEGILNNPLVPSLPKEIQQAGSLIKFTGSNRPSLPINWKFAESAASLKAFEATMLNVLRSRKYGVSLAEVEINTDHATLFVMTPFTTQVVTKDGEIKDYSAWHGDEYGFPSTDLHRSHDGLYRTLVTNIYRTKGGRYYHTHGSMNPEPSLKALGAPLEGGQGESYEKITGNFQSRVEKFDAENLDKIMNEDYKQAGTICWGVDEFKASEHGRANAHIGLYDVAKNNSHTQGPSWWSENLSNPSSASRPLAGLKVVDLCRVIAAPAITRGLAEMGASVMRITGPKDKVTDLHAVHHDLNWGKWNCTLDLKDEKDREVLRGLIREADVVVSGYRPGAMERNGFGRDDVFDLVKGRERGIIHVLENCYGWHGPWKHRSGWQQISDACCGVSLQYGKAMGLDEAVTPVWPNSDYCTGIVGATAVLHALIQRGEEGGSYSVDTALNYYSQWLVNSVGEYPPEVWSALWKRHGSPVYRHYHAMNHTVADMTKLLHEHDEEVLFNPDFFEKRLSKANGTTFLALKPVAKVAGVKLGFNVGNRTNGVDKAEWPEDLLTEIVGGDAPYEYEARRAL